MNTTVAENLNIATLNLQQAQKILADLATWPDVRPIIDEYFLRQEKLEAKKRELCQLDQNLADEQNTLETRIHDCDKSIDAHKYVIKRLNGHRGQYIKELNAIKAKREDLHREWCDKFANVEA